MLCQNESRCKSLFLKSPPPLILASTSRYRRELLDRLGLAFSCVASGADEAAQPGERPAALAARLARAKASAVSLKHQDAWVIGSDQVAVLIEEGGTESALGKPGTSARCVAQLKACSGRTISFLTAVAVMRHEDKALFEFIDTTRVKFRVLDPATIERYVAR